MGRLGRAWTLYQAIAFVALVPIMSYYVVTHGLPWKMLLFVIPCYLVLAWGSYTTFKSSKPK